MTSSHRDDDLTPTYTAEVGQPEPLRSGLVNQYSPAGELAIMNELGNAAADRSNPRRQRDIRIFVAIAVVPTAAIIVLSIVMGIVNS